MRVRKPALEFSACDESIFVHEMSPHVHLFSSFTANLPIISKDEAWHAACCFVLTIQGMKKE